jgi:serine/threonine-protein kinase
MNTTAMTTTPVAHRLLPGAVTPSHCTGTWGPAYEATYNGSGYTAIAAQSVFRDRTHKVAQAVVAFPDAAAAKAFYDKQISDWNACKSIHISFAYLGSGTEVDVGVPVVTGDVLALLIVPTTTGIAGQQCERDMTVRANVIVDVRACSPTVGSAGSSMVREIADKITTRP